MAPDIVFELFHITLQRQVHGSILDRQAAGLGQGVDQHDDIFRIAAFDGTAKAHDSDDVFLDLDGHHQHGSYALPHDLIPVLDSLIIGDIIDDDRLALHGLGDGLFGRQRPFV